MHDLLYAQAAETLEAVNRHIKHTLREAEEDGLDAEDLEALDECWDIKKDVAKTLHAVHEHKAQYAHGAGGMHGGMVKA